MKETAVSAHVRLEAARFNTLLYRNNVGVCQDHTGRVIRYGLANDSATLAKHVKSSDFIGITPVTITPDMVGKTVGVFTAVETKASGWRMIPSDKRALAQSKFHDIVKQAGGYAGFATCIEDFRRIIGK